MARILLIDDDAGGYISLLVKALQENGHDVRWLQCAEEALEELARRGGWEVILLDHKLSGGMDGLELLQQLHRRDVRVPVLLFTGMDGSDVAIRASKLGAFRYLPKPDDLKPASLAPLLRDVDDAAGSARAPAPLPADDVLPGKCPSMREVHCQVGLAATHDRPVLLVGEPGTGKERAAQAVHRYGSQADRPLLHVNCLALADEASQDDRLFGHEAGALPDGRERPGVFEQADGGAVLLKHFERLSPAVQVRVAGLIRDGVVYRNGRGSTPRPARVRVLASSSDDMSAARTDGRLYPELYWLLHPTTISLSPLRDRGDDVLLLAEYFLLQTANALRRRLWKLHPLAQQRLLAHRWPGNVRELQGVLRRAAQDCRGGEIGQDDLKLDAPAPAPSVAPEPERKLTLSRERAYGAYLDAIRRNPALKDATDDTVYRWLCGEGRTDDDADLPNCDTFKRYLRDARAYYDTHKNNPRGGRSGGSIARPDEI